jgi:hypothetical protein
MQRDFPLFQSHLDLAHAYWKQILQPGDWAIDATCGNGNDTLKLVEILGSALGGVIGIDLQQEAIEKTHELLSSKLSKESLGKVHLFTQSHASFPDIALKAPVRLIVYNLGYLPRGDKNLTTLTQTTLESVTRSLERIVPGGAISITCYPGHEEGAKEEIALLKMISSLSSDTWIACHHRFINREKAPSLLLIQKNR